MQLLTQKQQQRAERNMAVVKTFKEMRRRYPDASDGRIMSAMAEEHTHGLSSVAGIRKVLVECKAIPARRHDNH